MQLIEENGNFSSGNSFLTVYATNKSFSAIFIDYPVIITSEELDGTKEFQWIQPNRKEKKIELTPGQQYEFSLPIRPLAKQLLSRLSLNSTIRIKICDTRGKSYISKKQKTSLLLDRVEMKGQRY